MKTLTNKSRIATLLGIVALLVAAPGVLSANLSPKYLYNLSNFEGALPYEWVRVAMDEERNETYVVAGTVRVFNERGMEIYRFGDNADFGTILDIAVLKDGSLVLLTYKNEKYSLTLCDFRGEPTGTMELKGLPVDFAEFGPNRMLFKNNQFYFASLRAMKVMITDAEGNFTKAVDLAALLDIKEADRANHGIGNINVDNEGNVLFTDAVDAKAFVLAPDMTMKEFGKRGSGPGRFGVPSDIIRDKSGDYYLVADTLRSVVLVFDREFRFLREFGFRGLKPGNLIAPKTLALDGNGLIYVTQMRKRGVSVFTLGAETTDAERQGGDAGTSGTTAREMKGALQNYMDKFKK